MQAWKTLSRTLVLDDSPWLQVEHHRVQLPEGRIIDDWPWVITPEYVNVVVEAEDGGFLCFRQRKYGVEDVMLALVGGYMAAGEAPLAAARRELREETGYEAAEWQHLGHFLVDPNRGMAVGHLFLARGAHLAGPVTPDDLEEQELVRLSRGQLEAALGAGEF